MNINVNIAELYVVLSHREAVSWRQRVLSRGMTGSDGDLAARHVARSCTWPGTRGGRSSDTSADTTWRRRRLLLVACCCCHLWGCRSSFGDLLASTH